MRWCGVSGGGRRVKRYADAVEDGIHAVPEAVFEFLNDLMKE